MCRIFANSLVLLALMGSSVAQAESDNGRSRMLMAQATPAPAAPAVGRSTQPAATTPPAPTTAPSSSTSVPVAPAATTPPAAPAQGSATTASPPAPATGSPPGTPAATDEADPADASDAEDYSIGDIPLVESVELTAEKARKALDTYLLVKDKYKDAELENYENLQDFVDQAGEGKGFEADVKAAGFADVNEWNTAITTLSFAYANVADDQTAEIKLQIEEINNDTSMAQDMRDRMIKALNAMIPSENNRKILKDMMADASYAEKLKQISAEEE